MRIDYFTDENIQFKEHTYELVSKVAYLIGISERIFENENEPPQLDVFKAMDAEITARIIRHLCIIRTAIMRNYKAIKDKMKMEYRTILSMPELIPLESINRLSFDGINFIKKSSTKPRHHIIEINRLISDRINNCKHLFPVWLNWQYIRDLFIMPNGFTEDGVKAAAEVYYATMQFYPYQVYINWVPRDEGNILFNDRKFATLIYELNNDYFTDYSNVSDVGSRIKEIIYQYIDSSEKIVVVVDCENSDPYKFCAALQNLDYEYTKKISSIILFDDVHTASGWAILDYYTQIPIERILIERLKDDKSLVDIKLTARACKEHYVNNVDSFIIVSSDSDYWGLISTLTEVRFLIMVEREKCSGRLKDALTNSGIFYCYIDDFYSGNIDNIKHGALFAEMTKYINDNVSLNINDMFSKALHATRVDFSPAEKNQFYNKYVKTLTMTIDDDGNVIIDFKRR